MIAMTGLKIKFLRWVLSLVLGACGFSGGIAAAADAPVVLDAVDIKGGEGLSREMLTAAIGLSAGETMSRGDLDNRVEEGQRRLEALALFKSVDMRLAKGSERNHYILVVQLGPARAWYGGLTLFGNQDISHEDDDDYAYRHYDSFATAFWGSRALLGSNFRGEVSLSYLSFKYQTRSGQTAYGSSSRDTSLSQGLSAQLAAFDPTLGGTPWFAGLTLQNLELRTKSKYWYQPPSQPRIDETRKGGTRYKFVSLTLGRRLGLFSISANAVRTRSENFSSESTQKYPGYSDLSFSTSFFTDVIYSEKAGLARLEPGLVAKVIYSRSMAPDVETPTVRTTTSHSWIFDNNAITPALVSEWSYSHYCNNDQCSDHLEREHDASILYERSFARYVGGISWGSSRRYGSSYSEDNRIDRRWKATFGTTVDQFQVDLAFVYGDEGVERSLEKFLGVDRSRFTQ